MKQNYQKKSKNEIKKEHPIKIFGDLPKQYLLKKPACMYMSQCGGCHLQSLSYEGQLFVKQRYLKQLLKKYGNVSPIIKMENPYHYRNKVHAVLSQDRRGHLQCGMYKESSHHVIQIDTCLIENEKARAIINTLQQLIASFKLSIYDEDLREGLLRHILIRTGEHSGEILVVIVTAAQVFPSKKNFIKALLKHHPEITTIVQNVNKQTNSMVLGTQDIVLYGKGYIFDTLCGKSFKISPQSFYQVNALQTEKLYRKAIELASLNGSETVIDAYCGIGTIGIIASDYVKNAIGVELNPAAIKDAQLNKKNNNANNIDFYLDDAGGFMKKLAQERKAVHTVFMDPPRAGSSEIFLNALITLAPQKVIYISCNPDTLKRDLDYLSAHSDYHVEKIVPCDMFPMTQHVETVVLLSQLRNKPDDYIEVGVDLDELDLTASESRQRMKKSASM